MDTLLELSVQLIGMFVILRKKRKRWMNRRWWTRPINARRKEKGDFDHLFQELKDDPTMFFKYTRMKLKDFEELLEIISPYLAKHSLRQPLTAELRLAVTLRFLATGDQVISLALAYRIGISTCYNIIKETCENLGRILSPIYLRQPSEEEWKEIAATYLKKWNMPNCVGAVDGKHINIQAPQNTGTHYFNYKKTFSVVLLGICDANYKFVLVDIGATGSSCDGSIYSTTLGKTLKEGGLNIPTQKKLPGTNVLMSYFFVGDSAFQLSQNLMKPYPGHFLDESKAIFNYRLSRARRLIENSFGILASRWRIFRRPIAFNPQVTENITLSAVCLHNFLITKNQKEPHHMQVYCSVTFVDHEDENGQLIEGEWRHEPVPFKNVLNNAPHRATTAAYQQRNDLADYFISLEGQIPWQMDYIQRGKNLNKN